MVSYLAPRMDYGDELRLDDRSWSVLLYALASLSVLSVDIIQYYPVPFNLIKAY